MFTNINEITCNDAGIYILKNLNNNKCYMGSTNNIRKRVLQHQSKFNRNKNFNKTGMQDDWNLGHKFYIDIFLINNDISRKELYNLEEKYTKQYKYDINGYNYNAGNSAIG